MTRSSRYLPAMTSPGAREGWSTRSTMLAQILPHLQQSPQFGRPAAQVRPERNGESPSPLGRNEQRRASCGFWLWGRRFDGRGGAAPLGDGAGNGRRRPALNRACLTVGDRGALNVTAAAELGVAVGPNAVANLTLRCPSGKPLASEGTLVEGMRTARQCVVEPRRLGRSCEPQARQGGSSGAPRALRLPAHPELLPGIREEPVRALGLEHRSRPCARGRGGPRRNEDRLAAKPPKCRLRCPEGSAVAPSSVRTWSDQGP